MPALQWIEATRTTPSGTVHADDADVREAFFAKGLWPADLDRGADDAARRRAFLPVAEPIIKALPTATADDRASAARARKNLVVAGYVPGTGAAFMVSRENRRAVVMRLHHVLVERLQQGCEEMVKALQEPAAGVHFKLWQIQISAPGESNTMIRGAIVGRGLLARGRFLYRRARLRVVTAVVLATTLAALALVQLSGLRLPGALNTHLAGLTRGLVPATLIALIALWVELPPKGAIQWVHRTYEADAGV